jgi:hypothetical protein
MARLIERWLELRALAVLEEHRDREHAHAEAKAASDHHEGSPADLTRVRLKPIATSFRENRRRPGEVSCSPSKGINRSSFRVGFAKMVGAAGLEPATLSFEG